MKSMLIIAAFIAMAVAGPVHRGLVAPGMPGPTPVVDDFTPIAIGPALIDDFAPVNPIDITPVNPVVMPAAVESTPLVQIIVNINGNAVEVIAPTPVEAPMEVVDNVDAPIIPQPVVIGTPAVPEVNIPGPVNVVDNVQGPVIPQPVVIGTPALPEVVAPGPINVVDNVQGPVIPQPVQIGAPTLPEVVIPEAVVIGVPIIPAPAVSQPDTLN